MGIIKNNRIAWALGLLFVALCVIVYLALPLLPPPAAQSAAPLENSTCKEKAQGDGIGAVPSTPPSEAQALMTGPEPLTPSDPCSSGSCDPLTNGEGLYFANLLGTTKKDFCLPGLCPEAFVNAGGSVILQGRSRGDGEGHGAGALTERYVFVSVGGGSDFAVTRIASQNGALAITYKGADGQESTVTGGDLAGVAIKLRRNPVAGESTKLTLERAPASGSYPKYTVTYDQSSGSPHPTTLCAGEHVSFLPGRRIEFRSAHVTNADVVTFGCESGAIVKCMNAGYTQWGAEGKASPSQIDDVFASCLQAVRAAYFVAQGDYTSYTEEGTTINVNDKYGIHVGGINRLEAVWSSGGAECLSEWRHPELRSKVPLYVVIPEQCPPGSTENATLATGVVRPQTTGVMRPETRVTSLGSLILSLFPSARDARIPAGGGD